MKKFTKTWFAKHDFSLVRDESGFTNKEINILEIGSFEGLSACWMLDNYPNSTIDCVDVFDMNFFKSQCPRIEFEEDYNKLFDKNTEGYGSRVRKIKSLSADFFKGVSDKEKIYDLIYIDGDHSPKQIIEDAVSCFRLLKVGGILIFDDYLKNQYAKFDHKRPKFAIDSFVGCYGGVLKILNKSKIFAVRKTQ